jgi:hypothetical protein
VLSARPKPEDTAVADNADDGAFVAAVAKALH